MDRDPGLQAMQDIIDRMTREGASQEDIDAALMEFAYRHEHEKDAVAVKLPGLPDNAGAETCYLRACGLFEAFRDDEAAACLRRTLELQPDHYDARRMLIQLEDDDETLCQDLAALDEELEARWLHGHGAGESRGRRRCGRRLRRFGRRCCRHQRRHCRQRHRCRQRRRKRRHCRQRHCERLGRPARTHDAAHEGRPRVPQL